MPKEEQFSSPEFTGRDNYPLEISDELSESLFAGVNSNEPDSAGADAAPLCGFNPTRMKLVFDFENWAAKQKSENGILLDEEGIEIWRGNGGQNRISVPLEFPNSTFSHNHPNGTPPSFEDLIAGSVGRLIELRVITSGGTGFSIRFPHSAFESVGAMKSRLQYLDGASWAIAEEWMRSKDSEISENERMCRRYHAIYLQLADEGFLSYCRFDAGW